MSAVYIFTKRTVKDGKGSHLFLYIGETKELGTRIWNHEKWDCVNSHGCNCICVHSVPSDQARMNMETAFRNAHDTPCNDQ
ncbi:MAG: GIY-YIG nuclease family protein [Gammaproteobacteria bacterium]|nr:GIY-YIG nuclease family protein [Gammaproteobacteria bacterium]